MSAEIRRLVESVRDELAAVIQENGRPLPGLDVLHHWQRQLEAALLPALPPDDPPASEPPICTFCARGLPTFQLQSGTGNLWHRNEANQLFKCVGSALPAGPAAPPAEERRDEEKDDKSFARNGKTENQSTNPSTAPTD